MIHFDELKNAKGEIETENIKKVIPYKEPFLFIDKVTSLGVNKIVALKEIKGTEDFLKGHFVGFPIMPGALTVEGMGQAATFLARSNMSNHQEKDVLAYKLKEVSFTEPIFPGDTIKFEAEMLAQDERGAVCHGKAFVKDRQVAEAFMIIAIVSRSEFRQKHSR